MAYASAKTMQADAIPVIDLEPLRDNTNPSATAAALHSASRGLGFIYVRGHGITQSAIDAARASALTFFQSAEQEKHSVLVSAAHRGWLKPGAAKMGNGAKADLKESFIWGQQDGSALQDHPLRGKNPMAGIRSRFRKCGYGLL